MHTPTPSPSRIAKAVRWLFDVIRLPGRIRTLTETAEAERDGRIRCRNCAAGRITDLRDGGGYNSLALGRCTDCGLVWYVNPDLGTLHSVAGAQHQTPPP